MEKIADTKVTEEIDLETVLELLPELPKELLLSKKYRYTIENGVLAVYVTTLKLKKG